MRFLYPEAWFALLALLLFWWLLRLRFGGLEQLFAPEILQKLVRQNGGLGRRARLGLLAAAFTLGVLALARPVLPEGEVMLEESRIDLVVGFDISRSMFSDDLYPNRFAFARQKFHALLERFDEGNIALVGFSARGFLIAPLSRDFHTLRYLSDNLNPASVSQQGTSLLAALQSAQELMKESEKKALLLFTDGGDEEDLSEAIAYAKEHGIVVYLYGVGTEKGGVVRDDQGGMLKDEQGHLVITRLNEQAKRLALESGGAYLGASPDARDMEQILSHLRATFARHTLKEEKMAAQKELFVYPLALAVLLFLLSQSSLPQRRSRDA